MMMQNPLAPKPMGGPAPAPMNPTGSMGLQQSMPSPPNNALMQAIGGGLNAFRKSFDPEGYKASQDEAKTAEGDKLKQTLALMQQQRAIPEAQRGQWWQQNAPTISKIIGQDVSQMPLDVTKFSDQALDGQIAALSAQAGIGPVVPEPMSAYELEMLKLKQDEDKRNADKPMILSAGQRGYKDLDGDGTLDEVFSVPGNADGSDLKNGGVQSIRDLEDGRMLVTYRNGTTEVAVDPKSGGPAIARQNFGSFMAGDVPYIYNQRTGAPSVTQVLTPETVGQNVATVSGVAAFSKAARDARIQLPAAASQLTNIIGAAEQLRASPGFAGLYGGPIEAAAGAAGARFGADAEAQAIVDQIGGEAFLNAMQSLRGSGPVSEREGLAAQAAQSRLRNYNQSDKAAQKALDDFIERSTNVYLLQMLNARVPFSDEQIAALSPRQKALVAEWARFEGAQ
jgi:hypothetical protein